MEDGHLVRGKLKDNEIKIRSYVKTVKVNIFRFYLKNKKLKKLSKILARQ